MTKNLKFGNIYQKTDFFTVLVLNIAKYCDTIIMIGYPQQLQKGLKMEKKKSTSSKTIAKRIVLWLILCGTALAMLAVLGFYIVVVSGIFPTVTDTWICTAMTTMNHKYLATWFFSEEKIEKTMERNKVDDSGYSTDISEIEIQTPPETPDVSGETDEPEIIVDTYLEEGYSLLEEGLYLKEASGTNWKGWLMLITDPKRVRLEDTKRQFVCGQKVMTMIENAGAVAGINGGGFSDGPNYDSNGGTPAGMVIEDGVLVFPTDEESIKNETFSMVGMNSDGVLVLRRCTPEWAMANDIVSAVTFNPFIIVNGEGIVKNGTGGWGIAPRTAIGQRKTGEIIFLVIDGRQVGHSIGADLLPIQETLLAENCINAAMMDGGSSTVMIYNKEFVNRPSLGFERYINNCWVVMPIENKNETDE